MLIRKNLAILVFVCSSLNAGCGSWVGNPKKGDDDKKVQADNPSTVSFELASIDQTIKTNGGSFELNQMVPTFVAHHDVILHSYLVPIKRIYLYGADHELTLFSCDFANPKDCLVNLVGDPLNKLIEASLSAVDNAAGSYDGIMVNFSENCQADPDAKVEINAEANFDGATYYTNSDLGVSESGPSQEVELDMTVNCRESKFAKAVVVEEGLSLNFRSFFDLQHLATIERGRGIGSGCTTDGVRSICIVQPDFATTIASGATTVERYIISSPSYDSKGCLGLAGFFFDSEGNPFGGYLRGSFFEGQDCGGGSLGGGGVVNASLNEDKTLSWYDGVKGEPSSNYNDYQSFQRANHEGTANIRFGSEFSELSYSAVLLE